MSWAIAGDWLAVAGLLTLSIGTGMQALTDLADFRDLQTQASLAAVNDLTKNPEGRPTVLLPVGLLPVGPRGESARYPCPGR